MKKTPALIAAFVMTVIVAVGMLLVGANALFNPSSVALANAPSSTEALAAPVTGDAAAQVAQLQSLVAQYQSREKQYQQELSQLQTQVNQSSSQVQQYQQLLSEMQRRGLIQINQNGQILLPRGFSRGGDN